MNSFFGRRYVIAGIFITLILVILARLFYMQIIDDRYLIYSQNNVLRKIITYPARGAIFDRNGKILAQNEPVYDITVTPKNVKPFDTVEFCKLLGIDKEELIKRLDKARKYSPTLPSTFDKQIPINLFASLQERLPEFPGFDVLRRTIRSYPDSTAAQFLGFIGEVTDRDIAKSNNFYRQGDYIGRTGVERSYENILRGQRGVQYKLVDSRGVAKGSFANGAFDTLAVAGERLTSSLDIRIQKLGEKLMKNKVGSIVAIEPSTGEILAFVSSPTYDPNLLVGRERGNNAAKLYADPYNPFFIRPIQAYYPPGSSFKPLSGLIALQEGLITPQTTYFCNGVYWAGNHAVHCTHHHGVTDLALGIAGSCNVYFSSVFDKLINANGPKNTRSTFIDWREKVNKFGFGVKLGVDLPHEGRGNVPTPLHYDKIFGANHWRASTIISLAIGQGELEATPLQMANIECTIANKGYYYTPHLIKAIGDKNVIKKEFTEKHYVGVDSAYFDPVIDGMQQVVEHGTAAGSRITGITMCGKTGTAQNPHGNNHSIFVAFAPREHPRIAVAVVVENSGEGAWWAAPIASYIVEKYLRDTITSRPSGKTVSSIANTNLLPELPGQRALLLKAKKDTDSLSIKRRELRKELKPYKQDTVKPVQMQLKSASRKSHRDSVPRYFAAQIERKEDE